MAVPPSPTTETQLPPPARPRGTFEKKKKHLKTAPVRALKTLKQ